MHWKTHDSGVQVKVENGAVVAASTASSETNGNALDRRYSSSSVGDDALFRSAKVAILYNTGGSTGDILWNVQDSSATSAGWSDYNDKDGSTGQSVAVSTGASGEDAATFDLAGAKRYVRVQVTPPANATVAAAVVFGGGEYIETE